MLTDTIIYGVFQYGVPFQPFPVEVRMYYYVQIGMYLSLLFSISTDTKRKDFTEVYYEIVSSVHVSLITLSDVDPSRCDDPADVVFMVV